MVRRSVRIIALAAAAIALVAAAGCTSDSGPTRSPVVEAPAIGESGILRAGIDLSTPPYGGVDDGREAGIDVDVAAALAERLGVELAIVDVAPSEAATALAEGKVDIVLSVPFTETSSPGLVSAGTYVSKAPAFFVSVDGTASVEPSLTLSTVAPEKVAVQTGSPAYWLLRYEFGEAALAEFDSLREALAALSSGEVELAAGDALVGSYLGRDIKGVAFAGQLSPAEPLAVVAAETNVELADVVRRTLDELAADGVLDTVHRKWVGELTLEGIDE